MAKKNLETELDLIKQAISELREGASVDDISSLLKLEMPRRTLQRRLAFLVNRGDVTLEGGGRGSKYSLVTIHHLLADDIESIAELTNPTLEEYIKISEAGEEIKRFVRQAVQQREPVGYDQEFINSYQPNQTFYLSADIRQHLLEIGKLKTDGLPAGTYSLEIYNRLLIDLTWNSSRLEGNTYSLLETERLLAIGKGAEGKDALETQMILNHKAAIELLMDTSSSIGFNNYTICNLHALLSENLLIDPSACGRLREHPVGIGSSVFHPLDGGAVIKECFAQVLEKADAIQDPFEQAFFVMVHLPYLQPFDDVNKRVSRLAANISLIRNSLSPLSFIDVPEKSYIDGLLGVYELNRTELLRDVFVWAYERSCARYSAIQQSLGKPDPFRLRYREHVTKLVSGVVLGELDKQAAILMIKEFAESEVEEQSRKRFVEVAETELMSLHEGNIARYSLRPSQFNHWKNNWV